MGVVGWMVARKERIDGNEGLECMELREADGWVWKIGCFAKRELR